jgi:hypothetical protein
MEAIYSTETSVDTQWTTRHHIPEDDTLDNHHCENLKFNIFEIHFNFASHLHLYHPSVRFPLGFPVKTLIVFLLIAFHNDLSVALYICFSTV